MGSKSRSRHKLRRRSAEQLQAAARGYFKTQNKENEAPSKLPMKLCEKMGSTVKPTSRNLLPIKAQRRDIPDDQIRKMRGKLKQFQELHRNERRQITRAKLANMRLREKLKDLAGLECLAIRQQHEIATANNLVKQTESNAATTLSRAHSKETVLKDHLWEYVHILRNLRKHCIRAPRILAKAIEKAKTHPIVYKLLHKGVYTPEARALARLMVRSGCAQETVGRVLQQLGKILGVSIKNKMSSRTVRRAVLEGGIAADIQLGYEVMKSKSFTISGDGTSHQHTNYESRHITIHTPSYSSSSTDNERNVSQPQNCLLGVESSIDHTSETQVSGWIGRFGHIATAYNQAPLSHRSGDSLALSDFAIKLKGTSGDHAKDQQKTHALIQAWKEDTIRLMLAHDQLAAHPSTAVNNIAAEAMAATVATAGGETAWQSLPPEQQMALYIDKLHNVSRQLGDKIYNNLPAEEQRRLSLFLHLGCAMHKELNSVKRGNTAMMAEWQILGLEPPVLLANKDNAATLGGISERSDAMMAAEIRAFEVSARGGVKLTSLAGAVFNHKDDKKGQQDTHLYYFRQVVGQSTIFPDTSNTRYQTHCAAAAELLIHLNKYLDFLKVIHDKKDTPGFNHMEENVYKGLQDIPTLTELAILTVYAQSVTHPYMRVARVRQNGLKLGPLHEQLKAYIGMLITQPDAVLSPTAESTLGMTSMDGLDWEQPAAMQAVHRLAPRLPNLTPLFIAFLKGALATWERFSQEFTPEGAISQATPTEIEEVWMFSTNDDNEGMLGGLRVWKRANPNGTQEYFNAMKKHDHNDTAIFMATTFTQDDYAHIRREARVLDESRHEAKCQRYQAEHTIRVAEDRAREREEKHRKEAEEMTRIAAIPLIFDKDKLKRLKKDELEDQLTVYRKHLRIKKVPMKSKVGNKANILNEVQKAITRYHRRQARHAAGDLDESEESDGT